MTMCAFRENYLAAKNDKPSSGQVIETQDGSLNDSKNNLKFYKRDVESSLRKQNFSDLEHFTLESIENFDKAQNKGVEDVSSIMKTDAVREVLVNGMYARVLLIPPGLFMTGMVHKSPFIDICLHGDMDIKSFHFDGSVDKTERYQGFKIFEGKAGRKRIGCSYEKTLWITIDRTDADKVEDALSDIAFHTMAEYGKMIEAKK